MSQPIFYRHYDMKDRVQQSSRFPSLWFVIPMTTARDCHSAFMDDFGNLVPIDMLKFAIHLNA